MNISLLEFWRQPPDDVWHKEGESKEAAKNLQGHNCAQRSLFLKSESTGKKAC